LYHDRNAIAAQPIPNQAISSVDATAFPGYSTMSRISSSKKQQQHGFQQLRHGGSCCKFHMHYEASVQQQHCWQQHRELNSQQPAATELDVRLLELLTLHEKLTANAVTAEEAMQAVAAGAAAELSNHQLQQQHYSVQALVLQSSSNRSSRSSSSSCGSHLCYSSKQQQQQQSHLPSVNNAIATPAATACLRQQQQQLHVWFAPDLPVSGTEAPRPSRQ
jgi:hypothetical protein